MLLNTFANEIIAHSVSPTAGGNKLYYMDLCPIIEALNGYIKEELYLDFGPPKASSPLMNKYVYLSLLRIFCKKGLSVIE